MPGSAIGTAVSGLSRPALPNEAPPAGGSGSMTAHRDAGALEVERRREARDAGPDHDRAVLRESHWRFTETSGRVKVALAPWMSGGNGS